jgi:two-component system phosphate regulon response regulator PhoB
MSPPANPTITLLEDDPDIAKLICHHLERNGFRVRHWSNAKQILPEAQLHPPALFLLDILVPGGDGLDVCRSLRANSQLAGIPIIFVTAKGSEMDRVVGLELGGDDYITKPFSPQELVARVRAVLRRFERPLSPAAPLKIGDIVLDPGAMTLRVRGEDVTTTATEFRLLAFLMQNAGRAFSRDQILDAVWRETAFVTPRSVDVYVRRLREKIEEDPERPRYLRTLRGAGYRLEAHR